jgi:D-lactate dehydrogenase (cytochrome)
MRSQARTRQPRGGVQRPRWLESPEDVRPFLEDAAHTPGGAARAVALPETEGELAWVLRNTTGPVLAVGAQSSLTGGATPDGATVVATPRMAGCDLRGTERARVGAGLTLAALRDTLALRFLDYPPASTYTGATLGGTVATNAAGAATFKHGTTRDWVQGLTVVLANGEVLDLERGEVRADANGRFALELGSGERVDILAPRYRLPDVPKCSAGYYAAEGMDIVDLFIGSEGTLGIVTGMNLRLRPDVPRLTGWMTLPSEATALALVGALRSAAQATWAGHDPNGIDVAAIEAMDRRSIELLREDGADRNQGTSIPESAATALLLQAELPAGMTAAEAMAQIESLDDATADGPVLRLVRLLAEHVDLDDLEIVWPGETGRLAQLLALREAVPEAVNRRIAAAQAAHGPQVRKVAADMIVPFEQLDAMLASYRTILRERELDHALWGHVSDGNLHVNVIPRDVRDVEEGFAALLTFGDEVIRRGGSPLAEHGVGRNAVKQTLLRRLVGEEGVRQMAAVKRALDPEGRLAPGVLFPAALLAGADSSGGVR